MHQHFFSIKNIVKQLFVAGLIALVSLPVFANKNKQPIEAVMQAQPELKVIKSDDTGTLLDVKFDTETPVKFDIVIRDEAGNLIYRKNYESSKFSKQFKLVNEPGLNSGNLSVAIYLAGGKQFNYSVYNTVEVVKEVQVAKL